MKKLIITIMMMASFAAYAGQDGGGGGVIKRNGMYLTFGSAGMKVKLSAPQGMSQIPSLDLLLNVLDVNQGLPDAYQGTLIRALTPSLNRRYFRIDLNQLDSKTYKSLINEYVSLLGNQVDPTNLALAAITVKEDTFLLPPFFQLKPAEQAAILFHESLWIVKPEVTYDQLVNAEMVMQAHIERYGTQKVYNPGLVLVMSDLLNRPQYVLAEAIKMDIKNGVFEKYKIPKRSGYSKSYKNKRLKINSYYSLENIFPRGSYDSYNEYFMDLRRAIAKYPEFRFLKVMMALGDRIRADGLGLVLQGIPAQGEFSYDGYELEGYERYLYKGDYYDGVKYLSIWVHLEQ